MISRAHRFHGFNALSHVYKRGRTVRGPFVALKFIRQDQGKTWRCAVVVSKKVNKSAVARNRIRRRIYEVIRQYQTEITVPHDMVITVFDEKLADMPPVQLSGVLHELLSQARIV